MNIRTALAITILVLICAILVYPLFSGDEPPTPDPIEVIDPTPPVVTPGIPYTPAPPLLPPQQPLIEKPSGAVGDSCPGGVCPLAPTSEPEANVGTGTRRLFQRRSR